MRPFRLVLPVLAPLLVAAPAVAQWFDGPRGYYNAPPQPYGYGYGYGAPAPRVLPRDLVVERLEDLGFEDVGRPRLDGDVYTVTAMDPRGRRTRVAVDAYRGTVLRQVGLGSRDWLDEDDVRPRRRSGPFPDEMPGAPGFREPPDAIARVEPAPSVEPRLAPAAPIERRPVAPPAGAGRPAPADPRLAPDASSERPAEPKAEAARPEGGEPTARPTPPAGSGPLYGTNPETARPKAAARPAPTPSTPKPASSPAAPPPPAVQPKAADAAPPSTTAEGPRRPVRIIQGVTPLNSGGAQSTPAPQNNQAATPSP